MHENEAKTRRDARKPFVLWFTGLPCSGKSTLSNIAFEHLSEKGYKVETLDGDVVRAVFMNVGFTEEERNRHIQRVGFLASMLEKNGIIVVASFVSPYKESRAFVRKLCSNFREIYVSTSAKECERRDTKGMYKKARNGEIENFTGISDPYEVPDNPELIVDTEKETIEESSLKLKDLIDKLL